MPHKKIFFLRLPLGITYAKIYVAFFLSIKSDLPRKDTVEFRGALKDKSPNVNGGCAPAPAAVNGSAGAAEVDMIPVVGKQLTRTPPRIVEDVVSNENAPPAVAEAVAGDRRISSFYSPDVSLVVRKPRIRNKVNISLSEFDVSGGSSLGPSPAQNQAQDL